MPTEAFILKDVCKTYVDERGKHITAIKDVSLSIPRGSFAAVVGASGCGKSTLLRLLAGLQKPSGGEVVSEMHTLGMVFQNFALFPWLTVEENIGFGLKMKGVPKHEREKIIKEKMAEVGLHGHEKRYPRELSGGQRQRVGVARALAVNPEALLLDEPFSALDPFTAEVLKKDLFELWQKYKMTVVMVTHTIEDALELATDIFVMGRTPGTVIEHKHLGHTYPRDLRSSESFHHEDSIRTTIKAASV